MMGIFQKMRKGDAFKDKNEEDYIRYFETIILGHDD
jgi:hypothetical protein